MVMVVRGGCFMMVVMVVMMMTFHSVVIIFSEMPFVFRADALDERSRSDCAGMNIRLE